MQDGRIVALQARNEERLHNQKNLLNGSKGKMDELEKELAKTKARMITDRNKAENDNRALRSENVTLRTRNNESADRLGEQRKKAREAREALEKEQKQGAKQDEQVKELKKALEKQKVNNQNLRNRLEQKPTKDVFLNDGGSDETWATVIVPVNIEMMRSDFSILLTVLRNHQNTWQDEMQEGYYEWKYPDEERLTGLVSVSYISREVASSAVGTEGAGHWSRRGRREYSRRTTDNYNSHFPSLS